MTLKQLARIYALRYHFCGLDKGTPAGEYPDVEALEAAIFNEYANEDQKDKEYKAPADLPEEVSEVQPWEAFEYWDIERIMQSVDTLAGEFISFREEVVQC